LEALVFRIIDDVHTGQLNNGQLEHQQAAVPLEIIFMKLDV
jgi:hypothetical protein